MTPRRQWLTYELPLHLLGFALLWEWLRPLEQVTDTAYSYFFVGYLAYCFLLYVLNSAFWVSVPLRLIALLFILHQLFFEGAFFKVQWLPTFYGDLTLNAEKVLRLDWFELSDSFRTFLFLLLLWVLSYLVHYWLIEAKRMTVFFIITIVYLGVLDTFTEYNASFSIIRTMIIGLLIIGALQFFRLQEKERLPIRPYWFLILVGMIGLSVGLGYQAPKAGPQWPDPVPFLKRVATEGLSQSKKIGYGIDDSKLGGAFTDDNTIVFTARDKSAHYWRIESKDYYTGKGWIVSKDQQAAELDEKAINLGIFENVDYEETVKASITVENIGNYPHLAYPTDLRSLHIEGNPQLLVDPFTGKLSFEGEQPYAWKWYEMTYRYPRFSIDALKLANEGDRPSVKEVYTQLPDALPERVRVLANEITADKGTRYEKAKAVETYFSMNGFVYETKNVAIPQVDEDYVDQFLFDTKRGYCDNFSSSMVVLLRTLDIPTRWVKGYTQGEVKETLATGEKLYEVQNSNAHSWVEVYFPGIGWVPFEPTKGFSNPYTFTENIEPIVGQVGQLPEQDGKQTESVKNEEVKDDKQEKKGPNPFSLVEQRLWLKKIAVFVGLLLMFVWLLRKYKHLWYPYWVLANFRLRKNRQSPKNAMKVIFILLENKGLAMGRGETLREYARRVDENLGTIDMKKLVATYEVILYSNNEQMVDNRAFQELWENFAKSIVT